MSMYDLEAFLRSIHPFQLLSKQEMTKTIGVVNIAYYKKDTILISPLKPAEFYTLSSKVKWASIMTMS